MSQIKVYSKDSIRLGSTSKAFDTVISEELMREYTLNFSVSNTDSIFKYIAPDTIYECEGERFDVTGIDIDTTGVNVTSVSAEHISYRLSKYNVPANYAFVGTAKEIGADILAISGADAEFIMGDCSDVGIQSFTLNNDKEVTARAAIIALKGIGVEIQFSNFIINLPERLGTVKDMPLILARRSWQKDNGWTYNVDIADTGNIAVGDTFPIVSEGVEAGTTKRIITYERHLDDPTQNSVTLGVFIRDDASTTVEIENQLANSVQQGEKYSNVSITHKDGFMATNKAGTQRVMMNGDDCFIVQVKQNGEWVTVNSLEAFGLMIDRLTSIAAKDKFYIKVGKTTNGKYGLSFFVDSQEGFTISSMESEYINLFSPRYILIETEKAIRLKSTAYDAISEIEARNLLINTGNLVVTDMDENTSGRGFTETIKFVTRSDSGADYVREFKVIQGILTK